MKSIKKLQYFKIALGLSLLSCSTPSDFTQANFANQRLAVRACCVGQLTNQVISKTNVILSRYDLSDAPTRERINAAGFICFMDNKRYHVCKDRPGFCRIESQCAEWKRHLFSKKTCERYVETYLDAIKDFQLLLDSGLECYREAI